MSIRREAIKVGLGILFFCCAVSAQSSTTGFLYASDYGSQDLDRFQWTLTGNVLTFAADGLNNNASNAQFVTGGTFEGLLGTANDMILVQAGGASLTRYRLNGTVLAPFTVFNNGFTGGTGNTAGGTHTFAGVGGMAITQDGKFLYVAEETNGIIDKIDLKTGLIVHQVVFAGAHDLVLTPTGTLYAAAYSGHNASSQGVWSFDANLGTPNNMIAFNSNGLTRPTGMTYDKTNNILYVQQNVMATTGSVLKYNITGAGNTTATFVSSYTPSTTATDLVFNFGGDLGPDGNVYIADIGGGQTAGAFGQPAGYINGVYEFNTTSLVSSLAIAGYNTGTSSATNGFFSPKYLEFDTNFIPVGDAGFTPEPGGFALFGGLVTSAAMFAAKRRRRTTRARSRELSPP